MLKKYLQIIYTFWAHIYDHIVDRWFSFDREKVIASLKMQSQEKVLEVGVGTGLNLPFYPAGCEVYGIDFSHEMLKKARQKRHQAKVHLKYGEAGSLPFPDDFFDKAVGTFVIRVSPKPKKILAEVSRVVKKDGVFVIYDQFKGNQHSFLTALWKSLAKLFGWGQDYSIDDLLAQTSWEKVSDKSIGHPKSARLVVLRNDKDIKQ